MFSLRTLTATAVGLFLAVPLGACSNTSERAADGPIRIEASFYPLVWVTERVGGDHVTVRSLTKAGAEPHDLELTPSDVARVIDADLVVYLHGFQPAVDDAVTEARPDARFDTAESAGLDLTFTPIEDGEQPNSTSTIVDPHFWLDPTRLASVADDLAGRLASIDPDHASAFRANASTLVAELDALDDRYGTGLASCAGRELVTTHNAFGYLAQRYDLHQIGITGLTPEQEPSPADLAAVTRFVEKHQVGTIFFETLVGPGVARVVAQETGAATAVLDPLEGLTDASEGRDYLEVMASNLEQLRTGLGCT